jgi:cysteine synthase A
VDVNAEAAQYIEDVVEKEPVVMFALEWCEFCWSLRKLFDALGVKYKSVDIDSVEYQDDERGVKIRKALAERVGSPTMPQVFISGEYVGGSTDVIEEFQNGTLAERFARDEIDFDRSVELDAWSLLPQWLHPRKSA